MPSMPCEANRPLASHSERNQNKTRVMAYPALRRQRVLLREQSAAWEVTGSQTRNFRLSFVKERWYYRIHHVKSQWKKSPRQFVVCRGAPLWRNEPAKNKLGTSPRRSQRNQLEFAVALASEIFSGVITTSHFCVDALVSHVPASICSYFITTLQPFAV